MITCNIHSLLNKCFSDGFTLESLGKATNIPVELINRFYENKALTQEDLYTLNYLFNFLSQLYMVDVTDIKYLHNYVTSICNYFELPITVVEKYLGLEKEELQIFLANPEAYPNGFSYFAKLMHLFLTLLRDKRHSE